MQRRVEVKNLLLVLLAGVLLASCAAKNTVTTRKQDRYGVYSALTPEQRALVDSGQIAAGMNTDAVYIAWGKPGQTASGGNEAGQSTTWFYYGGYTEEMRYWGYRYPHYAYADRTYIRAQVTFVNGVVKEWQTFPQPGY